RHCRVGDESGPGAVHGRRWGCGTRHVECGTGVQPGVPGDATRCGRDDAMRWDTTGRWSAMIRSGVCLGLALLLCCAATAQQATPPSSDASLDEARTLMRTGQLSQAEAALSKYLEQHPSSADAHFLLGYVLFREQKARESLAAYTAGA